MWVGGRYGWPRRPNPGPGPTRRIQTANSKPRCGRHVAAGSFCHENRFTQIILIAVPMCSGLGLPNCRNSKTGFHAHLRHSPTYGVSLAAVIPSVLCVYGTTNCCFWSFASNLDVSANRLSSAHGSQIRSGKADSHTLSFSRQLVNVPCGAVSAHLLHRCYHQFIPFFDIKNILNI
jgi:hypothetical protein